MTDSLKPSHNSADQLVVAVNDGCFVDPCAASASYRLDEKRILEWRDAEYEDVLARPELRIPPARARAVIAHIELAGQQIEAEVLQADGFQDSDDLPFAEVFVTANAQALVTGNLRHFSPLIEKGLVVCSPAQFLERFFP